jgi:hypothetical protein
MNIDTTSETGAANYFRSVLVDEFRDMAKSIGDRNKNLDFDIFFTFFCVPKTHIRKTSCRFLNKKTLRIDIAFDESEFLNKLKVEQRFLFGHTVFDHLSFCLRNKMKRIEGIESLIDSFKTGMKAKGLLDDEIDYSLLEEGEF